VYLFDTDTLSNITKRNPSPRLLARLGTLPRAVQFTSAINIGEIYFDQAVKMKSLFDEVLDLYLAERKADKQ
jgi:predicted nucleic acid-binding protein